MKPYLEVFFDWKDLSEVGEGTLKLVVEWFGGRIVSHPATEGSDTIGFVISKEKLSSEELLKIENGFYDEE